MEQKIEKDFVPKLYDELKNRGYEPYFVRAKIMRDHTQWKEDTIRDALPDEAKDAKKQENGRSSSDARKAKALVKVKRWIYGNHVIYGKITTAFYTSQDDNFRIGLNSK